jgi:hypothetical protein
MPTVFRTLVFVCAFATVVRSGLADDYSVAPIEAVPQEVKPEIGKALAAPGFQVTGPDGVLCTVWFAKAPALQEGFSPTLSIKYPFAPGALIGVLKVEEGAEFTDFREQVLLPGLYTLRYARQPQDGNHIGTSDLSDFLLVVPAKADESPETIPNLDDIVPLSIEAGGATHPAILALRPADQGKAGQAKLAHDSADDLWMLETAIGSDKPQPLKLVVVGFALE